MNTNRYFYLFMFSALAAVITLTLQTAISTAAIIDADRSYDQIERIRAGQNRNNVPADRSYDAIEMIRLGNGPSDQSYDLVERVRVERRLSKVVADHSYDVIEQLRAQRAIP